MNISVITYNWIYIYIYILYGLVLYGRGANDLIRLRQDKVDFNWYYWTEMRDVVCLRTLI